MKLAVLFWFYKDVEVCKNRLQILRKYNPDIQIFGLYGGDVAKADFFEKNLSPYLTDFFCFTGNQHPGWKWVNGDLMINHWFLERGNELEWDTITIIQADMVAIGSMPKLFEGLKKDEILLSSVRLVKEVEAWWYWVKGRRELYDNFYKYMVKEMGYDAEPVCCQYVIVCLPKSFLSKYSKIENPELGFIEYRVPMYAQLFKTPFKIMDKFNCWWGDDPAMAQVPQYKKVLIADKVQIPLWVILWNLVRKKGSRIFHPYDYLFPLNFQTASNFTFERIRSIRHSKRFKK